MTRVLKDLVSLLQIHHLRTSVYHPQTDGLVERFNQTLKSMLKKVMEVDGKNWDQLLPHVLFAVREVPQASTGFSPFELLYGRRPRGGPRWQPPTVPREPTLLSLSARLPLPEVHVGEQLSPSQTQDMKEVVLQHLDVFSERPRRTMTVSHDIRTEPGVRVRPYRIPEARRAAIRTEVTNMLVMGVIEESHSAWSSPVVLVPKPDGTYRFCNDFRKLNEVSAIDAYPMPRIDELIKRRDTGRPREDGVRHP